MRCRWLLAAVLPLALLTGCGDQTGPPPPGGESGTLPDGWRWEGYAGVLVGVPGDWGWGNSSQRLGQWCVDGQTTDPIVGRPGASTLVGCMADSPVDPSTLLENTGPVVAFESGSGRAGVAPEGDQESVRIGDVVVRVNAPPGLRHQILATVHAADEDANGCAMHQPAGFRPGDRPDPARDLTTLTGTPTVTACRYAVMHETDDPAPLLSSLQLLGSPAISVLDAIAAAPTAGGPNAPDTCLPEWSYGDEMIVLQVDSDQGRSTAYVYYSGCDHNGIDDGTVVRGLTRAAVHPLVVDANAPSGWSGPAEKLRILR